MNWQSIIRDLRSHGLTLREIANGTSTGITTISEIGRGATVEPRASLAQRLLSLHASRCARVTASEPLADEMAKANPAQKRAA